MNSVKEINKHAQMSDEENRVKLAEQVVLRFNKENIPYVVVNGISEYPDKIGRDLDIVLNVDEVTRALRCIKEVGELHSCVNLFRWSYFGLYQSVLVTTNTNPVVSVPFDLLCTDYVWRAKFISLGSPSEILDTHTYYIGPFRVSSYSFFLKNIVRPFLCGDIKRFEQKSRLPSTIQEPEILDKVALKIGNRNLRRITAALEGDYKDLRSNILKIKWNIQIGYICKNYSAFVKNLYHMIKTRLMLKLKNRPVYISIVSLNNHTGCFDLNKLLPLLKTIFVQGSIVYINRDFFSDSKSVSKSMQRVLYFLWRNWFKDNVIPVSEFRVIFRCYSKGFAGISAFDNPFTIKKKLRSDALILLQENHTLNKTKVSFVASIYNRQQEESCEVSADDIKGFDEFIMRNIIQYIMLDSKFGYSSMVSNTGK